MTKEQIINKIMEYFRDNEETLNECIEELDNYNGYLGDDRYYQMEELNELYNGQDPIEILYRAFYGRDDDTYITHENGNREYGEFNPNREYFYFNGYGNLVSSNYKDYTAKLDHYLIEALSEHRIYIDSIDNDEELEELFNKLEEEQQ